MQNSTFDALVQELLPLLGTPQDHKSGSGTRFVSKSKGKATIYHSDLAPGNQAEIAVDIESNAVRLGISEQEMRDRIREARRSTGRDVELNTQYNWPRIGLASSDHIAAVLVALSPSRLG